MENLHHQLVLVIENSDGTETKVYSMVQWARKLESKGREELELKFYDYLAEVS